MMKVTSNLEFHPASYADSHGRLFTWQGGIYRAIDGEWTDFYRDFLAGPVCKELMADGILIETSISDLEVENHSLILTHRKIEIVSYPYEWCFSQLKDVALMVLDLQERLIESKMILQDCHPWNVMFDAHRPVVVDFGSIMPDLQGGTWIGYQEFREYLLNPLLMMSMGHSRIVRALFYRDQGVKDEELNSFLSTQKTEVAHEQTKGTPPSLWGALGYLMPRIKNKEATSPKSEMLGSGKPTHPFVNTIARLREQILSLELPAIQTEWSSYYEEFTPLKAPYANRKQQGVYEALKKAAPVRVLDVASNSGWYSQLAMSLGSQVVSFDLDERSIEQFYSAVKAQNLPIYPLVMDILSPSPALGIANKAFPAASSRFSAEMVMALAIVHHLVFKSLLSFDQIVESLTAFSTKWLLVEFIPKEDRYVSEWWSEKFSWYNLEGFLTELRKRYSVIEILESEPSPRVLLLCRI